MTNKPLPNTPAVRYSLESGDEPWYRLRRVVAGGYSLVYMPTQIKASGQTIAECIDKINKAI